MAYNTPRAEYEALRAQGLAHHQVMKRMSKRNRRTVAQADRAQAQALGNLQAGESFTGFQLGNEQVAGGETVFTGLGDGQYTSSLTKDYTVKEGDTVEKISEETESDLGKVMEETEGDPIPGTTLDLDFKVGQLFPDELPQGDLDVAKAKLEAEDYQQPAGRYEMDMANAASEGTMPRFTPGQTAGLRGYQSPYLPNPTAAGLQGAGVAMSAMAPGYGGSRPTLAEWDGGIMADRIPNPNQSYSLAEGTDTLSRDALLREQLGIDKGELYIPDDIDPETGVSKTEQQLARDILNDGVRDKPRREDYQMNDLGQKKYEEAYSDYEDLLNTAYPGPGRTGPTAWANSRAGGDISALSDAELAAAFTDQEIMYLISQGILKMGVGKPPVVNGMGGVKGVASGIGDGGGGGGGSVGGYYPNGGQTPRDIRQNAQIALTSWRI